ncbi:hypothetical protein TSUD_69100 [Trifolium subterraneum]|uniref:non-specific serine/threonine protein kinase n=1 Tax=Trifolium subterraneum TaxID=3900 RepID=A0A2Z6NU63_TRISU|nr:hypothetical protein TSUD_69100 [Trifolium subterraneum]
MAVVAAPKKTNSINKKDNPNLLLGRFELGKLLGHGTFAKVHLAKNLKTGESVAIKIISKDKILKSGLVSHIKREISILRRVRHPNIVQLFEVMATKTKIYFVMEYVRGGELFNKVAKGRCPRWFSPELVNLLTRLLDIKPHTRISIPEIMENRWFKIGFKSIKFYVEDDVVCNVDSLEFDDGGGDGDNKVVNFDDHRDEVLESVSDTEWDPEALSRRNNRARGLMPRPASLNAFDIISFSQGFDLSGLFEEKGDEARFVSSASVPKILSKLEEVAQLVQFNVRKKDCRVSLEGSREGAKGPLTIAAEVFELTSSLVVVEVKKKGGDKVEYEKFLNTELKPALHSLIVEEESAGSSSQTTPDESLQQRAFSDSAIDKHSDSIEALNLDT